MWLQLLLQLLLILLNAFFASTEIAVLSLNENKIKLKAQDGDKKAQRMLKMLQEPSGFLSTIQIGITLAGFLGSAFAADNFAGSIGDWMAALTGMPVSTAHTIALIVVTLILSYFTLVLGELVPKRVAMKKPEAVASFTSGVVSGLSRVMKPVIWLLSASTNGMLKLFGIDPNEEEEQVTEEDLLMMVGVSEEGGNIDADEGQLIRNIFHFDNITAEDVMTHRTMVSALPLTASDDEILALISESGYSRIPVYDGQIDNIVGILVSRAYLVDRNEGKNTSLKDLMMDVFYVPETTAADHLFREMQQKKIHFAVVLDRFGGTSGIVTLEDLMEEIMGEIYDETD